MGYAFYDINRPDGTPMLRGYAVQSHCHHPGCKEVIDRGMAYLCYSCTEYFCTKHRTYAYCECGNEIEFGCFAGDSSQACHECAKSSKCAQCEENECLTFILPVVK